MIYRGDLGWQATWWIFALTSSRELGVWWLGIGRFRLILKAPWNRPLFSERYGLTRTLRLVSGWRVQVRTI